MKKIKDKEKWKRYYLKKQRKVLKRDKRKKHKKARIAEKRGPQKVHYKAVQKRHKRLEIKAPENFSLINNVEETLWFFDEIHDLIKKGENIYLDLRDVKALSTDAILYMLSNIDFSRSSGKRAKIGGNFPVDDMCKRLFVTSGFFKFVYSSGKLQTDPDTFSIESQSTVSPAVAQAIKNFAVNSLKKIPEAKDLYKNIIECMANTRHHAYVSHLSYLKWWIMASYDKDAQKIHFTFLDNGLGIPTTIRKNLGEYVKQLAGIKLNDGRLIQSALEGQFRTQTGEPYRGKGLPVINKTAKEKKIENLIIISKKGYVNVSKGDVAELERDFHGTLLSWDFN